MDAFRIANLRCIKDSGYIKLKPLTLVVGQNSSGKSSFLRTFPLLRQSVETRTTGPILWYGRFVDFGTFESALSRFAEHRIITFGFKLLLPKSHRERYVGTYPRADFNVLESTPLSLELRVSGDPASSLTRTAGVDINFHDQAIKINFSNEGRITSFIVNGKDFTGEAENVAVYQSRTGLLPNFINKGETTRYIRSDGTVVVAREDGPSRKLYELIEKHIHGNSDSIVALNVGLSLGIGSSASILSQVQSPAVGEIGGALWRRHASEWDIQSSEFLELRDALVAAIALDLVEHVGALLNDDLLSINYIAPLRATAERYYRIQDLAVDEVDYQGRNLAMFLRNLTKSEVDAFSDWCQTHFGIRPGIRESAGHLSLMLSHSQDEDAYNLADMGFGFSQVLPILAQLWAASAERVQRTRVRRRPSRTTFVMEQPELHLHPSLQARLADALLASLKRPSVRNDFRLIIETHSETMVNRFGHRIARGDFDPKDVSVIVFDKAGSSKPTDIRVGTYGKDGFLTNWPLGFFEPESI